MNGRWTGNIFPLGSNSWVAHMREEARQTAAWEADPPTISHKTWQVENPDLLLCCTAGRCQTPATVAPLPACPQTVVLCFALCLSLSRVSPITFLVTCLSSIAMKTKGFWWELDGNERNLMGTKGFWRVTMGTRGTWWELFGNLVRTKGFWWDIAGNKRNLMGTFWELDGKSSPHPFKKIENIPWEHVCTTQLAHPFKN